MCPNGAFTYEIATYCIQNGAKFKTVDVTKSVSGQLSKMRDAGHVTFETFGNMYKWKLIIYDNRLIDNISTPKTSFSLDKYKNSENTIDGKINKLDYESNITYEPLREEVKIGGFFKVIIILILLIPLIIWLPFALMKSPYYIKPSIVSIIGAFSALISYFICWGAFIDDFMCNSFKAKEYFKSMKLILILCLISVFMALFL